MKGRVTVRSPAGTGASLGVVAGKQQSQVLAQRAAVELAAEGRRSSSPSGVDDAVDGDGDLRPAQLGSVESEEASRGSAGESSAASSLGEDTELHASELDDIIDHDAMNHVGLPTARQG